MNLLTALSDSIEYNEKEAEEAVKISNLARFYIDCRFAEDEGT